MKTLSRTVTVVALAAALTGPALGASADAPHWKTLASISGGKIQGCKVPVTSTGPWKIKLRVDATHASGRVSGVGYITKNDQLTAKQWKSGWVARGAVSSVGLLKLPADAKYALSAGIGTGAMGNGGTFAADDLPHC